MVVVSIDRYCSYCGQKTECVMSSKLITCTVCKNVISVINPFSYTDITQKVDSNKITSEYERLLKLYTDNELEELTGLLAIYVNHMRSPTENWKRLKEILK